MRLALAGPHPRPDVFLVRPTTAPETITLHLGGPR
jgi:hypothetical protein